jgi:malonate-semialdehyde dehydrogenase (acetylating)/methylmalonate-semialdehyde dehydrogenase
MSNNEPARVSEARGKTGASRAETSNMQGGGSAGAREGTRKTLTSFIDGASCAANGTHHPISNPATGEVIGNASFATANDVNLAADAARRAFGSWSATGLQSRANLLLDLREAIRTGRNELIELAILEVGKTRKDAAAEVDRSIEILAQAASVGNWFGAQATVGATKGVDVQEVRFPIGVVAAIGPFNFPVMVPILQASMAIACGNSVIVKPSERSPSASILIGELFKKAGLPPGVYNALLGDKSVVDQLVEHRDIAGISFVGSTFVASDIRARGVARHKRVQAFGGGKNHLVVMPDADLDAAADAAVAAAFGAAGQRCMAVSVVVAVGPIADALVGRIAERTGQLVVGSPADAATDVGPVITKESRANLASHIDALGPHGAKLVVDGRALRTESNGWFMGPTVVDHVTPGTPLHKNELFGPLLSVVRVASLEHALDVIAEHALGNGAAIFTRDGAAAKRFVDRADAGMIGVNVPIPFPVFFHSFGGWKGSAFAETKLFGPGALGFHTRTKTVSTRWPEGVAPGAPNLAFS